MPTPDASQFTQFKKYAAIDSRTNTAGGKQITHLSPFVPSVLRPLDFLTSFSNKVVTPCNFIPINSPLGNANGKKSSYAPPIPTISNLIIQSSDGPGGQTASLSWTETNTTSRSATCVVTASPSTSVPGALSYLSAGFVLVTNQSTQGPYTVTITVTNSYGSASASINVTVGCFLGFVKVETLGGPVAIEDIVVGTKILQPSGRYSNVVELKRTTITDMFANGDGRLYADAEEKMVVTYWHKIRFSDETEEVKAGEHPRLHQVFRATPFDVFHIKLENPVHDKVLIHDTDITAESFIPVNPL